MSQTRNVVRMELLPAVRCIAKPELAADGGFAAFQLFVNLTAGLALMRSW